MTYFNLEITHQAIWNCTIVNPLIRKHFRHQFIISYWAKFSKLIKFITQSCMSLLNYLHIIWNSTLSAFLKSLWLFFLLACLQVSSEQICSVNKLSCLMWSSNLFSASKLFMVQVFQGPGFHSPGFSGSRSRVQVQGLGPGFRSSNLITLSLSYEMS